MSKLLNITGKWHVIKENEIDKDGNISFEYNDEDIWQGQILLEEDGWFEGIVVDTYSTYKKDRFIFGIYLPNKLIELYKFIPVNVSAPFVFHGAKFSENDKEYNGTCGMLSMRGEIPYAAACIATSDAKTGDMNFAISELRKRIQDYKETDMDEPCREFYNNSIVQKDVILEILLHKYHGVEFTGEEIEEMLEKCQPILDRIIEKENEAVNQLIKELSFDLIFNDSCDEDDLPF